MPEISRFRFSAGFRLFSSLSVFLFISAIYLYTFPQATVFYAAIVLVHAIAGVVATILLAVYLYRLLREGTFVSGLGWVLVGAAAVLGILLIKIGTPRAEWNWLYL